MFDYKNISFKILSITDIAYLSKVIAIKVRTLAVTEPYDIRLLQVQYILPKGQCLKNETKKQNMITIL